MNPTLEKVARVLEPQAWAALGTGDTLAYQSRRVSSLRKARAALTALLPPSEEMVEAMYQSLRQGAGCLIHPHDLAAAFAAAIRQVGERAKSPKPKPTKRCPDAWSPSLADLAVGAEEGFSPGEIERELAKIRDFEFVTARADWSAVFRNWLRRAAEIRSIHQGQRHERPNHRTTRR